MSLSTNEDNSWEYNDSNGWEYSKLKNTQKQLPDQELFSIIKSFNRSDIFNHGYSVSDLFNHTYKDASKAKRQPNPFMLFRVVVGLVAKRSGNIKIGDGTQQSKLAGHMWGSATPSEKESFKYLGEQFKLYHKNEFPSYEYKPKPRSANPGIHFDTKTPNDYQQPTVYDNLVLQEIDSVDQTYYYPTSIIEGFNFEPSITYPEQTPYTEIPQIASDTINGYQNQLMNDMIDGYQETPQPVSDMLGYQLDASWGEPTKQDELTKHGSNIYYSSEPSIAANLQNLTPITSFYNYDYGFLDLNSTFRNNGFPN